MTVRQFLWTLAIVAVSMAIINRIPQLKALVG